jgi:GAF domain-containing protein
MVILLTPNDDHTLQVTFQSDGMPGNVPTLTGRLLPIGEGLAGRVFQTQQPMSIANYHEWDGRSPLFDDPPLYAGMSVPLVAGEVALGVLSVFELKTGRVFTEQDREVLEALATQAAVCLRFAQLNALEPVQARKHP